MTVPSDRREAQRFLLATATFLLCAPTSIILVSLHLLVGLVFALPAVASSMYLYSLATREVEEESAGSRGAIRKSMRASVVQQELLGEEAFRRALSLAVLRPAPWLWFRRGGLAVLVVAVLLWFAVMLFG